VTEISDSLSGTIDYTYNDYACSSCSGSALNRIASETTPDGTVSYSYDADGHRTLMTFPGTPDVTYTWNDAGRLININRSIGGSSKDFAITYDAGGRRNTLQVPLFKKKGKWQYLTTTYGFDIANRLTSLLHENPTGAIASFAWNYDANGNRDSVNQSTTIPLAAPVASASYDEANEMLTQDGATFSYDENGNLESRTDSCGTTTFTWDGRNRLTGISGYKPDCSSLSASFSYDALNRRTEKTINGVTSQYVYDGWDILQDTTDGVTTDYTRTLNIDEPLALERSDGTIRYYKADALGSIVALTDENGLVTTSYVYDAFGNVTVSGSDANAIQYTGRENDGTGLYYYRARYYSPGTRRFVSEDPIRLVGGVNYYAYVQNNPVNFIDPLGLFDFKYYGNYGGPGWTAGEWRSWEDIKPGTTIPAPIDSQDFSYLRHDQCYGICRNSCNEDGQWACFNRCDNNLVQDLLNVDNSSLNLDIHRNLAVPTFVGQQIYSGLNNAFPRIYNGFTGAFR
jgi:RHS repeat-associated protein